MVGSDEDRGRSRKLGAEDRGCSSIGPVLDGRKIERLGALCAVCTVHKETWSTGFLVLPQNKGRQFLPVWPQNRWLRVLKVP
jgi:hypothetical protein